MTYNFTFDSRETYLAYRADWKARYHEASVLIRATKRNIRSAYLQGNFNEASARQSLLVSRRNQANELMLELVAAKEFSSQQRCAAIAA